MRRAHNAAGPSLKRRLAWLWPRPSLRELVIVGLVIAGGCLALALLSERVVIIVL